MNHRPFPSPSGRPFVTGKRLSKKRPPQQLAYSIVLVLFLFAGLPGNIVSAVPAVQAASTAKRPRPPAPASMTVQQFLKEGRKDHAYHGSLLRPKKVLTVPLSPKDTHANYLHLPPTAEPGKMQSISQPLDTLFTTSGATGKPLDLKGSDGRLEVQLQAGSLDLTHATVSGGSTPNGSLTLQITQLHGHYYSQLNELGAYILQVVDSKGHPVGGIVLRTPLTFIYHYQPTELQALNLDSNHILLTWPTLLLAARAAKQPTTALVTALKNDAQTHTLMGQSNVLGPGPFDLVSTPQVQAPPALLLAGVSGNNGQLSFSYPLQVPPGPAGFAPQLSLVYSSLAPNSRSSRTAPANDEGDGWSLTLGSITMDNYSSSSGAAAPGNWYFLNDVANVSDRMVPDSTSTFFQTQHISHLRIQQVTSGSTGQPCFNVWDTSGTYYQLGCTSDSLQYYNNSGTQTFYRWDVNKIIAPNDNNSAFKIILVSYFQDCVPSLAMRQQQQCAR